MSGGLGDKPDCWHAYSAVLQKPCCGEVAKLFQCRSFKPWQLGVLLFGVGNILNFFSFGEDIAVILLERAPDYLLLQ